MCVAGPIQYRSLEPGTMCSVDSRHCTCILQIIDIPTYTVDKCIAILPRKNTVVLKKNENISIQTIQEISL